MAINLMNTLFSIIIKNGLEMVFITKKMTIREHFNFCHRTILNTPTFVIM